MLTLEPEKCSGCGLCVQVCHESCLVLTSGLPVLQPHLCSTCTQCIAICPRQALSWDHIPPAAFERQRLPSPAQLDELFKQRRSILVFKQQPVGRALLEEIAGYGIYAPTHNFSLRVVLVDDPSLIADLDETLMRINRRIYRLVYRNCWIAWLAGLLGYADEFLKARPKIEEALQRLRSFISTPAALLFIVGDKKVPLSEASAQFALANRFYFAQVRGVGACLWGNAQIFHDRDRAVRRRLGVTGRERIYGALYLGYPAVRFTNKVIGKAIPIQWF